MNNAQGIVLVCTLCAGGTCSFAARAESPTKLEVSQGTVIDVAHIYYNIASDERVITLFGAGQSIGADTGYSHAIWSARVRNPCAAQGFTSAHFFGFDDNSGTASLSTNVTLSDWGDIAVDTLVDCVHINWVTDHDDVDDDSDGIGDGISGLAGQWAFYDSDNGRVLNGCMRYPIVSFMFTDLPGDVSGTSPDEPNNTLASYTVDVDLSAAFTGTSLVFEIGDSDGDLQGANYGNNDLDIDSDGVGDGISVGDMSTDGNGNPLLDRDFDGNPDWDLDLDGLFDWSWSVRFFQPGTADLDSDGVIDGDITDSFRAIGVNIALPEGTAIDNGDTTWTWQLDTSAVDAGNGHEDAFAFYDAAGSHAGTFFFGGLSCVASSTGEYSVVAGFEFQLFGPGSGVINECGDLAEPFGTYNFFDVSAFLSAFSAEQSEADLAAPFGVWNFFDVSAFLGCFTNGGNLGFSSE